MTDQVSSGAPVGRDGAWRRNLVFGGALLTGIALAVVLMRTVPAVQTFVLGEQAGTTAGKSAEDAHDHAGHDHNHAGHNERTSIEVSEQARRNIGLQITKLAPTTFDRTLAVPAVVIERAGRSELDITAALAGIVERIYPIQGETVLPGQPLFDVRLTHEELVQAQTDFLRTAEELDIAKQELTRLEPLERDGTIPTKTTLDLRYQQRKLAGVLRAQREGLILHGLSDQQVDTILERRKLLSGLTIHVPYNEQPRAESPQLNSPQNHAPAESVAIDRHSPTQSLAKLFHVQQLNVERGQFVNAGERLAILSDHTELYIAGKAFEQDATWLNQVVEQNRDVTAIFETGEKQPRIITGLKVLYVADSIETDSRTLRFFVRLPNELLRDTRSPDGNRFIAWRFKPGQRLQLKIPVESWADRFVLPADGLVQDGVESYVFQANGNHFDRKPVRVEYRDPFHVVIANDGSVFPGDMLVTAGAQQLQLALKNKSGGAIDPHAGHNH